MAKKPETRGKKLPNLKARGAKGAKKNDAGQVRGGRAGGDKPVKYMEYKLKEVLISGV